MLVLETRVDRNLLLEFISRSTNNYALRHLHLTSTRLRRVDLRQGRRLIRQRHEDLAPLSLPFRDRLFDQCDADPVSFCYQQFSGELLFGEGSRDEVSKETEVLPAVLTSASAPWPSRGYVCVLTSRA